MSPAKGLRGVGLPQNVCTHLGILQWIDGKADQNINLASHWTTTTWIKESNSLTDHRVCRKQNKTKQKKYKRIQKKKNRKNTKLNIHLWSIQTIYLRLVWEYKHMILLYKPIIRTKIGFLFSFLYPSLLLLPGLQMISVGDSCRSLRIRSHVWESWTMLCNVSESRRHLKMFPGCICEGGLALGVLPSAQRWGGDVSYYLGEGKKVWSATNRL